jgi:hypothetical protein
MKSVHRCGHVSERGGVEMKITDKEVLKELKRARSGELWESLDSYPEDERGDRTDMQILADECSYILSCFEEDGHCLHDDLQEAKEIMRETKNGKTIPLWRESLTPVYSKHKIEAARDYINEHRRLKSLMARLNKQGIYGRW